MPIETDPKIVRARLNTDRPWSAYALGDLTPALAGRTEWRLGPAGAVLLLYRAFETPVLFTLGGPAEIAPLLDEIAGEARMYLSIKPDVLPLIKARYRVTHEAAMLRMTLAAEDFVPPAEGAVRLTLADLPRLKALYADGDAAGEAPDFFDAEMLAQGVFYGVEDAPGGALAAAAGTHLVAPEEGVAAIGNVYTRRDRRGRGLAGRATGAVAAALLAYAPRLDLIALNVNQQNPAAVSVYERLGFRAYGPFYEGLAHRTEK